MPKGQGKYDLECRLLLDNVGADAVAIVVIGGVRGDGVSLAVHVDKRMEARRVADFLRLLATNMEQDLCEDLPHA
jgi:hypothetical protein